MVGVSCCVFRACNDVRRILGLELQLADRFENYIVSREGNLSRHEPHR